MKKLRFTSLIIVLNIFFCFSSCVKNGQNYYNEGVSFSELNKFDEAIERYTKGIICEDDYKSANLLGRANSNYELGNYELALKDLNRCLLAERSNSKIVNRDTYWELASIAGATREKEKEKLFLKKALKYDPGNIELRITYALILIEQDLINEGLKIMDEIINEGYKDAFVYNNRALGLIKLEKYNIAKLDLDNSKSLDDQNPFVYRNYFLYYMGIGDKIKACKNIEKALSLDIIKYGWKKDVVEFEKLHLENCLNNNSKRIKKHEPVGF
jgi:tetratricopeptide (TPR) repeat protein